MDGEPIWKQKVVDSKISRYVFTALKIGIEAYIQKNKVIIYLEAKKGISVSTQVINKNYIMVPL